MSALMPFADDFFTDYYRKKHLDPIYGEIELLPYQQRIVATPHFNRLRDLKQTGEAHHVFSGATHTRFAHSIGVAHLAKQMYRHLTSHSPQNPYSALEEMLVVTAAMCHDIGHAAHSHAFELWAKGRFNHEEMSVRVIQHAVQKGYFEFLKEQPLTYDNGVRDKLQGNPAAIGQHNVALISAMILGIEEAEAVKLLPRDKLWLFDIVHNQIIDVDKSDYLVRDMHAIFGTANPHVRVSQIIDATLIVNGRVRFNVLVCNQLYDLLYLRASLHKNVYTHDLVCAVKYMYLDLLDMLDADTDQSITKATESVDAFLFLSDCVFQPWSTVRNTSPAARVLMARIATQDYYSIVTRKIVFCNPADVSVGEILVRYALISQRPVQALNSSNLFFVVCRYDLGSGVKDPLQKKVFYRSSQYGEVECFKASESSSCFYDEKQHSVEYLVRLYTKVPPESVALTEWQLLCDAFHQVFSDGCFMTRP
jgi:HD superfamily phosphohydrolase